MGEYLVYLDDVLIGQITDGRLFMKVTPYGEQQLDDSHKASPYPGAKAAFHIPAAKLTDTAWLVEFAQQTKRHLQQ